MQAFHVGIIAALMALLAFAFETTAQQQDWLSYYPSVSRLQGKLIKVQKYGKPSYGENPENDEKVEIAILILKSPVRIKASSASWPGSTTSLTRPRPSASAPRSPARYQGKPTS